MSFSKETIADLAESCLSKFRIIVEGETPDSYDVLRSRLADFHLWADTVGATTKFFLSLGSKFRNKPDDLALIKSVLGLLNDCLADYIVLRTKGSSTIEALGNIEQLIRHLTLIGVAIRQMGKASRSRRADETFDPDEHREFRQHLECIVLLRPSDGLNSVEINNPIETTQNEADQHEHFAEKAKHLFSARLSELDPSRLSPVQKRLIEANLRRRHRFLLAQKRYMHANKKEQPVSASLFDKEVVPELQPLDSVAIPMVTSNVTALLEGHKLGAEIAVPKIANLSLASTAEETSRYTPPSKKQKPASKIAQSQISLIAADTKFPKPPPLSSELLVSICPCCCQSFPSEHFSSFTTWT